MCNQGSEVGGEDGATFSNDQWARAGRPQGANENLGISNFLTLRVEGRDGGKGKSKIRWIQIPSWVPWGGSSLTGTCAKSLMSCLLRAFDSRDFQRLTH